MTTTDDLLIAAVGGAEPQWAAAVGPDAYTVYHGAHWTRINQGHALVGEIDFAIVNPVGNLLLVEQKSGRQKCHGK